MPKPFCTVSSKKVPRVREKISVLLFVEEATEKLKDCTANANIVKSALEELRSEKLRSILEIALAVGNYLNNPKAEMQRFPFVQFVEA